MSKSQQIMGSPNGQQGAQDQQEKNLKQSLSRIKNKIVVMSGKGGVGKTSTSVNLAIALAERSRRVVLLDADLGLANVEVLLGLNSLYNLQHVIDGEKTILQILVKGPGGIHVVPGSSGIAKLADLGPAASRSLESFLTAQERAEHGRLQCP